MRTTALPIMLLSRASLIASAFAGLSAPALAQETGASAADDEAIIVTARRREENLVDVPIAITALSADQLERTGALDITAVADQAPNVTLEASRATNFCTYSLTNSAGSSGGVASTPGGGACQEIESTELVVMCANVTDGMHSAGVMIRLGT